MLSEVHPWKSSIFPSYSPGGKSHMAMVMMEREHAMLDSTPLLGEPEALRKRARRDGYLLLRQLLPAREVARVRQVVLAHCRGMDWLAEGTGPLEARVRPGQEAVLECRDAAWGRFYRLLYTERLLHAFNQHPRMLAATEALFGEPVLPHPRLIVRVMFPGTERFTTPPHQDYFYIRGTEQTWTAWIPLGDCPEELGGLAVARGSHRRGRLPVHRADGAGGHGVEVEENSEWVWSPMAAGDVLLFHSLTIHQARDNRTADQLRLSCDFRYQPRSQPVHPGSLQPHMGYLDWDCVYAGWAKRDRLRHYWRSWSLAEEAEEAEA